MEEDFPTQIQDTMKIIFLLQRILGRRNKKYNGPPRYTCLNHNVEVEESLLHYFDVIVEELLSFLLLLLIVL